jgi:mono/diheme cytochrome c family protein
VPPNPLTNSTDAEPGYPIFATIIVVLVILAAAAAVYFKMNSSGGTSTTSASGKPEFTDPSSIPELEIKGEKPDGEMPWSGMSVPAKPAFTPELAEQGHKLFTKACAGCHGADGQGEGPVPQRFDFVSMPANLTKPNESIKIRSTMMESIPLDTDLFRTITRGMPGTAMWSYRKLPEADRWALIAYIKTLSNNYGQQPDPEKIPPKPANTEDLRASGRLVFGTVCQNCHGQDGLGSVVPLKDHATDKLFPGIAWARKGGTETLAGSTDEDLARTLLTGFHRRSPMLSWKNSFYGSADPSPADKIEGDRKLWGTVFYCRELMERAK